MWTWLINKVAGPRDGWRRVHQSPGTTFPFPKGAKLRPESEVVLALPATLIRDDEKIGSILLCDDGAELTLNEKVGAWYVKLKPGMTFSLARSSEVMLVAREGPPLFFHYSPPQKTNEAG